MFITTETKAFEKNFWIKLRCDFLRRKEVTFFCVISPLFAHLWEKDNDFKREVRGLALLWTSSLGEFSSRTVGYTILFRLWGINQKDLKTQYDSDESRNLRLNFLDWVIDFLTKSNY